MEPANFYVALSECSLLEKRSDRLAYLKTLSERNPFSAHVTNRYASLLKESFEKGDKNVSGSKIDEVVALCKKSITVSPDIENPAWEMLFDTYANQADSARNKELLDEIVDKHLEQDAFSADTSSILLKYCRKYKSPEFRGKPVLEYLQAAYQNHFPRDYPAHLAVILDACIEFRAISVLQRYIEDVRSRVVIEESPRLVEFMMDVSYDVHRDLDSAISCGRSFLKKGKSTSVELHLLSLYLEKGLFAKAREIHSNLQGAVDICQWLRLNATILEYEGRFQDAADVIESIPDKREFEERYTSQAFIP